MLACDRCIPVQIVDRDQKKQVYPLLIRPALAAFKARQAAGHVVLQHPRLVAEQRRGRVRLANLCRPQADVSGACCAVEEDPMDRKALLDMLNRGWELVRELNGDKFLIKKQ